MEIRDTSIAGCRLITSQPFVDERGFFLRTMMADEFAAAGIDPRTFVQHSQSRSSQGVVRGIHFRTDGGEARLVRCARGAMYDVVVDLRPHSPTFGRWESFLLDDVDHRQIFVPHGCGHAFQALTDWVDTCYLQSKRHEPGVDGCIRWNDPQIGIRWPAPARLMSKRDAASPFLADCLDDLTTWFGAL